MRLCHVSPHLPPDQAANSLLPAQLGAWAAAAGHEITYVTQDPAQGRAQAAPLRGQVRRVSARRSSSPVVRFLRVDSWIRARAISVALNDMATGRDLVHLHSNGLIIEVASGWARRRGTPTVLTLYGTEIWHYRRRWPIDPFTRAYMRATAVTFYSQRLLERALSLGLRRPGLSVVYPPVSASFVARDAVTRAEWRRDLGINEPLVVLNVKRLHELAGQRYLIEAFARVARRRDDVRLVVCGTGPLRHDLEERAAAVGVAAKVTFAGLVANDVVARYAAVADVFVLPSLLEALPTVAVEALAAGTPVISADHPGGLELNEIFGDDVSVVPRQNAEALAEKLEDALAAPRRTRPATAVVVRNRFSPAAVQAAYAAIYEAALAGTSGATGATGPR
jgi:glycosyltransferase involved in cell wall biosynthesis